MPINVNYTVRETGLNLVRNISLTIATVLTTAVTLALVGFVFLVGAAFDNATQVWRGDIEFIVYFTPGADQSQIDSVGSDLDNNPGVSDARFVGIDETCEEFQDLFRDSPEFRDSVECDDLPTSWRVVPRDNDDIEGIRALAAQFQTRPGVQEVALAEDSIRDLLNFSRDIRVMLSAGAVVLVVSSTLLIFNTVRVAVFARRREIEIQKLVGATNWFIRLPFVLEGTVQGVLGAALAFGVISGRRFIPIQLDGIAQFGLFQSVSVTPGQVVWTGIAMLGFGVLLGAISAAIAVTRYLDV